MARAKPSVSLSTLRRYRALPTGRPLSIAPEMATIARELGHAARAEDALDHAWRSLAPANLRERAGTLSLSRGVLSVRTPDASARFELDRWLRAGGMARLARACGRGISRVRFSN